MINAQELFDSLLADGDAIRIRRLELEMSGKYLDAARIDLLIKLKKLFDGYMQANTGAKSK